MREFVITIGDGMILRDVRVKAERARVNAAGSLAFFDGNARTLAAIAAGSWSTVSEVVDGQSLFTRVDGPREQG